MYVCMCITLSVGCVHCIFIAHRVFLCTRARVTKHRGISFQVSKRNILLFIKINL